MAVDRGMGAMPVIVRPPVPRVAQKPPPQKSSRAVSRQPVQQKPQASSQDWRSKYLSQQFTRSLSPEATKIAEAVRPVSGLIGKLLGNAYYPALNAITLGSVTGGYPEHEYTHAIAGKLGVEQAVYSAATPEQRQAVKQYYATTPRFERAWNRNTAQEFTATQVQIAGRDMLFKIPQNLWSAYGNVFNQQARIDAMRHRTLNYTRPWAISLPG